MIDENQIVRIFAGGFPRSPKQLNSLFDADAELISNGTETIAITVDGLSEELATGLYSDPQLIGWMAVNVSLSDLAAVGASPIGLLIDVQLPQHLRPEYTCQLSNGIRQACDIHQTYVLGGDTNSGESLRISSVALGRTEKPITRKGATPGDWLYSTGPLGLGAAYAISKFILPQEYVCYRPHARLAAGKVIREFASCCIDTSDGLIPALAQLSDVNRVGFSLEVEVRQLVHPECRRLSIENEIPSWMFLAGPHGEFELIFTISPDRTEMFLSAASKENLVPIRLGKVVPGHQLSFQEENLTVTTSPYIVANLFGKCDNDPKKYLEALHQIHRVWNNNFNLGRSE